MSVIQTAQINIPSDPEAIKKIRSVMQTISDSYSKIEGHRELIKDELKALADEYEIPKSYLARASKLYHKQNFSVFTADTEATEELYERIFPQSNQ